VSLNVQGIPVLTE